MQKRIAIKFAAYSISTSITQNGRTKATYLLQGAFGSEEEKKAWLEGADVKVSIPASILNKQHHPETFVREEAATTVAA